MKSLRSLFTLTAACPLLFVSCASYQSKISDAYENLRNGHPNVAVDLLKNQANEDGKDQLVFLLEYATALHLAGRYEESTKAFMTADKLAEIKDYHSISKISASLLLNEGQTQYKGEDFELVLINAYLAINFAVQNKFEDALVECRRLNEKLQKYRIDAKRNYEQNPFARYLSALLWEADRNWDSAYIDYKEAYRLEPDLAYLREDLLYTAKKAHRDEDLEVWKRDFAGTKVDPNKDDKDYGEIVLIYQQGQGPIKRENPAWESLPRLYPRFSAGQQAELLIANEDGTAAAEPVRSQLVFNSEKISIKTLDDAYSELVAKRVAGIGVKAVVADQIRQKDKLVGQLAWIGMNIADRADLRQWSTLPQTFQVVRKMLKAGSYKIRARALTAYSSPTGEEMPEKTIQILPRKKTILTWRSFR